MAIKDDTFSFHTCSRRVPDPNQEAGRPSPHHHHLAAVQQSCLLCCSHPVGNRRPNKTSRHLRLCRMQEIHSMPLTRSSERRPSLLHHNRRRYANQLCLQPPCTTSWCHSRKRGRGSRGRGSRFNPLPQSLPPFASGPLHPLHLCALSMFALQFSMRA